MRGSLAKLYQVLGFQRAVVNVEDIESISKARHDRDGAASLTVLNPSDHTTDEPLNATHTSYSSWLVSFFSFYYFLNWSLVFLMIHVSGQLTRTSTNPGVNPAGHLRGVKLKFKQSSAYQT